MSAPESLTDVYADEMKDLWSANEQMTKTIKTMASKAHDSKLKAMLEESVSGIAKHTGVLKQLIEGSDELEMEHCKGMEGLCKEALKHTTKEASDNGDLLDVTIIAQYQRMSHYGLAGFGSAAAYAKALGKEDDVTQLKGIVAEIYKSDKYASKLGEKLASVAPKQD